MELVFIIVALLALLALAFWIKARRLRRASLEIIKRFHEQGAVKEKKAKTLEEMGLRSKPKHPFGMRDNQVEALSHLLRQGVICSVEQGGDNPDEVKFYFDEVKYPIVQ